MNDKRNALFSVFDKTGVVEIAQVLIAAGWKIFASGGTARHLTEHGIEVTDIATIVGPPILGHRVVTLSREVHAGLLAKDTPEDWAELEQLGIPWIDLVYVSMYPLESTVATKGDDIEAVTEATDIGGPAMLRSAAKGRRIVLTQLATPEEVKRYIALDGHEDKRNRLLLAAHAEQTVSWYAGVSGNYLHSMRYDE